ncbi:MAG: cupin domain-containing protein [Bacteroidota bacterium]
MNKLTLTVLLFTWSFYSLNAQNNKSGVFRIPQDQLAGEGLTFRESKLEVYQKKVYDGAELGIYMVAIGNGTNEFEDFPIEEFIFWMNGKAKVEPHQGEPFEVQTGDYFIQAKGYKGKWSFVGKDKIHLELAVVAKQRSDSSLRSPISKAMVIDRNILSGASKNHQEPIAEVYSGVELAVNLINKEYKTSQNQEKEKLLQVLNGILKVTSEDGATDTFYPGDFLVIPKNFKGQCESVGFQTLRAFEVYSATGS